MTVACTCPDASVIFCRLEHIRDRLVAHDITDIKFIIVNSKYQPAVDNVGEIARRVSFPVYQDTSGNDIWSMLNGGKDDILIYDR